MYKFIKNVLLLLCSLCLCVIFAFLYNPPKKYRYSHISGACKFQSEWIYATFNDTNHYDVICIGSSKTMNAVQDSFISFHTNYNVINIVLCGLGRNKDYVLLDDFIKNHITKPKMLILECNAWENTHSNSDFAYLADGSLLLENFFTFNRERFSDVHNALQLVNPICFLRLIVTYKTLCDHTHMDI